MYKFVNDPYRFHPFYDADKGGGGGAAGPGAGDGGQEDETAGGDDQGAEDAGEDGEDDADEKKYTQADMDAAIEKRLAREKRKWQREQQRSEKPDGKAKTGNDGEGGTHDEELTKERKRNESLTMRLACYEAGVPKDSVKDVTALAKSYMEEDEQLDFEDAIEQVLKKYPHFKGSSDGEGGEKGAWGQRQKGKGAKKDKSLEDEIEEALYGK